jgi:hypothetical protein
MGKAKKADRLFIAMSCVDEKGRRVVDMCPIECYNSSKKIRKGCRIVFNMRKCVLHAVRLLKRIAILGEITEHITIIGFARVFYIRRFQNVFD